MKRKIFSIFFALVLVLSFSLVTAVPAAAVVVEGTDVTLTVPDNVYRPVEFVASSTATNSGTEYDLVRFNITVSGPEDFTGDRADTFTITDTNDPKGVQGFNDTFVLVDGDWVGYWGPEGGFTLIDPYEATSTFTTQMNDTGTAPLVDYDVTVELVDLTPDPDVILASATDSFSLSADTLYVGTTEYQYQFNTIQDAIDSATGTTINVAAGTYNEALEINKALTLRGANVGVNPVTETRGAESIIDAGGADRAVNILSNLGVVTFEGFTVQNFANQGICHRFDEQEGTTVHVLNNIVVAEGVSPAHGNSIQVSGDDSTVIGNDVSGAVLLSEDWTGTAILVTAADNVTVRGNFVHDAQLGIGVTGLEAYEGPATNTLIELNTVQDSVYGISVQSDSRNTMIKYNDVLNNGLGEPDGSGIESMSWGVTPSGTEIHFNNIVGNLPYGVVSYEWVDGIGPVIASSNSEEVNATHNWWGGFAGPVTVGVPPDNPYKDPAGMQGNDTISDGVDYLPWLIQIELVEGWNIWSDPIILDEACLPQLEAALLEGVADPAYYFDSSTQDWYNIPEDASPMDAWYIKMKTPVTVNLWASSEATFPSQKEMKIGWNFVGLAELHPMKANEALFDAYYGTGEAKLFGYSKVISPSLNGLSWTYLRPFIMRGGDCPPMFPTKGYWVLMVNDGVLGGFTSTPIVEVLPPKN